jgi:hypothetical protein
MARQVVDPQRLDDLRAALQKLDPQSKKAWILEVYDRQDGEDRLSAVVDIKTGKPVRPPGTVNDKRGMGG